MRKPRSPEYILWINIRQRCNNPKNNSFAYYGGRGITVCRKWSESFEAFYEDVGPRPAPNYQLDRRNNNKGYCKSNCRWVTKHPQMQKTRLSKWWIVDGVRYASLSLAAESHGVTINRIKAWCEGRTDGGYTYPPKPNCWSEQKYVSL